ncbi:MAG: hypothetical protein PGN34_16810 [Methylobacterium frigidaeris]
MKRHRAGSGNPGPAKPRSAYEQESYAQESYAQEYARTAGDQAAFFREQAERRRRDAEQARAFASLAGGETGSGQDQRAHRLEILGRHEDAVAETFEARARRPS